MNIFDYYQSPANPQGGFPNADAQQTMLDQQYSGTTLADLSGVGAIQPQNEKQAGGGNACTPDANGNYSEECLKMMIKERQVPIQDFSGMWKMGLNSPSLSGVPNYSNRGFGAFQQAQLPRLPQMNLGMPAQALPNMLRQMGGLMALSKRGSSPPSNVIAINPLQQMRGLVGDR